MAKKKPKEEAEDSEDSELEDLIQESEQDSEEESSEEDESLTESNQSEPLGEAIIEDREFQQFITTIESGPPVLERTFAQQEPADLEQDVFSVEAPETSGTLGDYAVSNTPDYSAPSTESTQAQGYESTIEPPVLEPIRDTDLPRQQLLDPLADMRVNLQNDMDTKRVETEFRQEDRRMPFETEQEKKYKRVSLR